MDFNKENYKKVYLLAKKAKANDANALAELNQLGFEDLKSAVAWVWDCKKSEEQPEATDAPVFDNSIKLTEDKDEEEVEVQPEEEVTAEDVAEEDPATGDITVDTEEITAEPVEVAEPTEEEQDQGIASVLTQAIQDKWANVDKYNSYITTIKDDANAADLVKTLKDIVTDETIHAGLLSKALAEYNPEVADGLNKDATEHSEEELKEIETEEPVEEALAKDGDVSSLAVEGKFTCVFTTGDQRELPLPKANKIEYDVKTFDTEDEARAFAKEKIKETSDVYGFNCVYIFDTDCEEIDYLTEGLKESLIESIVYVPNDEKFEGDKVEEELNEGFTVGNVVQLKPQFNKAKVGVDVPLKVVQVFDGGKTLAVELLRDDVLYDKGQRFKGPADAFRPGKVQNQAQQNTVDNKTTTRLQYESNGWEAYKKYANEKKAGRIARYRHLANLKDDDIITKDNIDEWAFRKTCCEGNICAEELEEELLEK